MEKWDTIKKFTKIPKSKFLKILQFCLTDNNYFVYDNKIINQIFGMPMCNPLSPTIADIVLDSLLDEAIAELKKKNIYLKCITKYVDDIWAIINIDDSDEILGVINKYHPKIQFTIEMEKNGELAYLDTKLYKENGKIYFNWYAKEMSSEGLMNFNATQPKSQIINTARNFVFRVLCISDKQYYTKNFKKITAILKNNSFPLELINSLIEDTCRKLETEICENNEIQENDNTVFYSVKYIPGLTDNKNIKTTMETKNIHFAYKPNKTIEEK